METMVSRELVPTTPSTFCTPAPDDCLHQAQVVVAKTSIIITSGFGMKMKLSSSKQDLALGDDFTWSTHQLATRRSGFESPGDRLDLLYLALAAAVLQRVRKAVSYEVKQQRGSNSPNFAPKLNPVQCLQSHFCNICGLYMSHWPLSLLNMIIVSTLNKKILITISGSQLLGGTQAIAKTLISVPWNVFNNF